MTTDPNGDKVETKQVSDAAGDVATTKVKSFYGGEIQETSIRDATGRTSISRIRSESPRGRFWTRAGYWGNQAVVAPVARAPVVLEPSKLGDSLATSLHVEARNRQLDDPLDARSLYPLTGPLMRRSYLLDDPLFPNGIDLPAYRNADADTSPWCRRAAYLDDPSYRHSAYRAAAGDPLYRGSSDYYGVHQLTDPLCRGAFADPLYRGAFVDPLYRSTFADPLYRGALVDPLYRRSALRALSPRARLFSPRSRRFL